jgi:hypothetical protein
MPRKTIKNTQRKIRRKTEKIGGEFKEGKQCTKQSDSYKKLEKLSSYINENKLYNWSIHKTTGHFCDLFIWLGKNQDPHIHVYSIEGNTIKYSITYLNLHHQQVSLENESDFDYKNALDIMCKKINPNHVSFNTTNLKTPDRSIYRSSIKRPKKSAKKPQSMISDLVRNPKRLGPTSFKNAATNGSKSIL